MTTTIHLHPQPGDFKAGCHGAGEHHPAYATVDMDSDSVRTVIFLDSAAKCDALIKAAVEAKRLLLGEDIPPALEQDLAQADADPANPYGAAAKHGEFNAASAAEVAEGVEGKPPFHVTGTSAQGCGAEWGGYVCTAQLGHAGPDHIGYVPGDDFHWPVASPLAPPAPYSTPAIEVPADDAR